MFGVTDTQFFENTAVRGGAVSLSVTLLNSFGWENTNATDNIARVAGGALFFFRDIPNIDKKHISGNNAFKYGEQYASTINHTEWFYILVGDTKVSLGDKIQVFPGQKFSLLPELYDSFNNTIPSLIEVVTMEINQGNFTLSRNSFQELFFYAQEVDQHVADIFLIISFSNIVQKIPITIVDCPSGYSMTEANYGDSSSFICKSKASVSTIIALSVVITVIVFTFVIVIMVILGFLAHKFMLKLKFWLRRDRAEKDMELRLLEHEMKSPGIDTEKLSLELGTKSYIIGVDEIELTKKIGQGGYTVVYLGKWRHKVVAVKCMKLSGIFHKDNYSESIEQEATLLCKLCHPNIITFYGIGISSTTEYLVEEYLERGSLEKMIAEMRRKDEPLHVPFSQKLKILLDIASGMIYLHSLKPIPIIHQDLKPANILLDLLGNAKVCDFGISKLMTHTIGNTLTSCIGTLFYMVSCFIHHVFIFSD